MMIEWLRIWKHLFWRWLHQPKMLYGYKGKDGIFYKKVRISSSAVFVRESNIAIQDHTFIGHFTYLDGSGRLEIGEGCHISAHASLLTHSSHMLIRLLGKNYLDHLDIPAAINSKLPTRIGRFVFIGDGAIVLPGTTVGDGAIIGAGAVVRCDVLPGSIVAGNPATQIGTVEEKDLELLAKFPQFKDTYFRKYLVQIPA